MKKVELFTDGACSGNPGPGGWGVLLRYKTTEKQLSGAEEDTTNNRMELMAVIAGLEALTQPCDVTITTDSRYIADAFNENWLDTWLSNGWKTAGKKPVKNRELWERLLEETARHKVTWQWIKGHSGHEENEICDRLAVEARTKLEEEIKNRES
ncbi:MAG: ribonuclease HI [Candidatus Riflebacteria bacterium]|nr:ribonuclease HI [Candidatus Riflebacteria bacterium]